MMRGRRCENGGYRLNTTTPSDLMAEIRHPLISGCLEALYTCTQRGIFIVVPSTAHATILTRAETSVLVQQGKPLFATLASHVRAPTQSPTVLLLFQRLDPRPNYSTSDLANVPGKAVEESPTAWAPATWETWTELQIPGFNLNQPWQLWPLADGSSFPSPCHSTFQINN